MADSICIRSGLNKLWGAMAFALVLMPVSASALTLDTTYLQANAVFSLSEDALDAMSSVRTSISAAGNTSLVAGNLASDGSSIPAFNLPVTKVDVSLGLPLFGGQLVTPNSGNASGSALIISRGSNTIALANFFIDYKTSLVMADITANGVTTKSTSLYSFNASKLDVGVSGLALTMHQDLTQLMFTSSAAATFSSALKLPSVYRPVLDGLDFGTITVDVKTALRPGVNATPFITSVPEAPSYAAMGLGLLGIAAVSRRKAKN